MELQEIIKQAIDLHVHIGPEIIPRKYTISSLVESERGKLKAIGVKNHFFPTVAMNNVLSMGDFIIYSVALNNYVGGFNPEVIRASTELAKSPIIVWFPTISAENVLAQQSAEIPTEWIGKKDKFIERSTSSIKGLSVLNKDGKLKEEVLQVLQVIKENNSILATGHLSWKESRELVRVAVSKFNIRKIIITHPIYQKIDMPLAIQKELADMGAFIEQCYSMYSIDKIPIEKIVQQIRYLGAERCIISSDIGQTFSLSPSEALSEFAALLKGVGVSNEELRVMMNINPGSLIQT